MDRARPAHNSTSAAVDTPAQPAPTAMPAPQAQLHSGTHFAAASALNPLLHHAVDLSRLHSPVVVPDTDELTNPAIDQRWVPVRDCVVSGWSELCDVDPLPAPAGARTDRRAQPGSPAVLLRWREILPEQFVLLRIRDAAWDRSPSGERVVGVHRRQLVPVRSAVAEPHAGRSADLRAQLRTAWYRQERIMVELIDGTRLVGTAELAPRGADLLLLSARRGCAPIPVNIVHITHVGLVGAPGTW
jgi:hypothetical protein